jgi:hypothetical protein
MDMAASRVGATIEFAADALEEPVVADAELELEAEPEPELPGTVTLLVLLDDGFGNKKVKAVAFPSPVEFKGVKPQFSSTVRETE